MAPPSGIYVDIVTSMTPNGPVQAGQDFMWYNSGGNDDCKVTDVGGWCTAGEYGPIKAGQSVQGHALPTDATGTYPFQCGCCMAANPGVGVHNTHIPGKETTAA